MKLRHPHRLLLAIAYIIAIVAFFFPPQQDKPLDTTPAATKLASIQQQADELAFALFEDLTALKARQHAYELAAKAGTDATFVDFAWDEATEAGLDPLLVLAVIEQESGWDATLVHRNSDGSVDRGLGQINSRTWPSLAKAAGATDPLDPKDNIKATVYHLAYLSREYRTTDAILTSYNRGEEGLRQWYASRGTVRSPYSEAVQRRMYR